MYHLFNELFILNQDEIEELERENRLHSQQVCDYTRVWRVFFVCCLCFKLWGMTGSHAKNGVEGDGKKTEKRWCRYDIPKECNFKAVRNR